MGLKNKWGMQSKNGLQNVWGNIVFFISVNSLRPIQNGHLYADDTFKLIFLNENIRISTKNSLKFVPKGLINNILALVLIMAWCRPGNKPLSEPMLVRSLTHICVTQPQWVKELDVIVHKNYFPCTCITLLNFGHSAPHLTSEPGGWCGNYA